MPELSLSVKELSEIISAGSKAFDDLYSTLRRIGVDAWMAGDSIVRGVRNKTREATIRRTILHFRGLQVAKLTAASAISDYMYSSSEARWVVLADKLSKVFRETAEAVEMIKTAKFADEAVRLGSAYPTTLEALHARSSLTLRFKDRAPVKNEEFDQLVILSDVLDGEAALIGKCADAMTEHLKEFRDKYIR